MCRVNHSYRWQIVAYFISRHQNITRNALKWNRDRINTWMSPTFSILPVGLFLVTEWHHVGQVYIIACPSIAVDLHESPGDSLRVHAVRLSVWLAGDVPPKTIVADTAARVGAVRATERLLLRERCRSDHVYSDGLSCRVAYSGEIKLQYIPGWGKLDSFWRRVPQA